MEIVELATGDIVVLGLKGRLDALAADGARDKLLAKVSANGPRLVLDLADLGYVSSAGLRVFLEVSKRISAADGKLALCAMVRQVLQVFELAGFASFISIYPSRDDACNAVRPPSV